MTKALLDTTIVVDQLLGSASKRNAAASLLSTFLDTRTVAYALLELRRGALGNFIYAYNVLAECDSVEEAHDRIQAAGAFKPRRGQIGTKAIVRALEAAKNAPQVPEQDARMATLAYLGPEIFRAWKARKSVAKKTTHPLSCFVQDELLLDGGRLRTKSGHLGCQPKVHCGAAVHLKELEDAVQELVDALRPPKKGESEKREISNIRSALKEVLKRDKGEFPRRKCAALGDAYFCLVADQDEVILTTNKGDFEMLAAPLGKAVEHP